MASSLVVLRQLPCKIVLVPHRTTPIVVEPTRTSSIIIRRSDIPGTPGPQGPQGPPGPTSEGSANFDPGDLTLYFENRLV